VTKRERVLASIRRGPLDAIPWQFDLTSAVADRVRAYLGADDLVTALDDHMVAAWMPDPAPLILESVPQGCWRDAFGAVWRTAAAERAVGLGLVAGLRLIGDLAAVLDAARLDREREHVGRDGADGAFQI